MKSFDSKYRFLNNVKVLRVHTIVYAHVFFFIIYLICDPLWAELRRVVQKNGKRRNLAKMKMEKSERKKKSTTLLVKISLALSDK